jgi:hypothetical protein
MHRHAPRAKYPQELSRVVAIGCEYVESEAVLDRRMKDLTEITPCWGHIPSIPTPYKRVDDINDALQDHAQYQSECGDVARPPL